MFLVFLFSILAISFARENLDYIENFGEPNKEKVDSILFTGFKTYANEKDLKKEWDYGYSKYIHVLNDIKKKEDYCKYPCTFSNDVTFDECIKECNEIIKDESDKNLLTEILGAKANIINTVTTNLVAIYGLGTHSDSKKAIFSKKDLESLAELYIPDLLKEAKKTMGNEYNEKDFRETFGLYIENYILENHIAGEGEEANVSFLDAVKNSAIFKEMTKKGLSPGAIAGIVIACVVVVLIAILVPTLLVLKKKGKICKK